MNDDRMQRIQRILTCTEALVQGFSPGRDRAWAQCDLTMPQLKALMYVTQNEDATSGQIANRLGVGLSTITGIVDRLVEQGMASRYEDPRDRRINRVQATSRGRALVEELLQLRNDILNAVLSQLDAHELEVVETAFQYLIEAAAKVTSRHTPSEAVA